MGCAWGVTRHSHAQVFPEVKCWAFPLTSVLFWAPQKLRLIEAPVNCSLSQAHTLVFPCMKLAKKQLGHSLFLCPPHRGVVRGGCCPSQSHRVCEWRTVWEAHTRTRILWQLNTSSCLWNAEAEASHVGRRVPYLGRRIPAGCSLPLCCPVPSLSALELWPTQTKTLNF